MKNSHLKNSLIAAGIAVFAGVVTLGASVAIGATPAPTQDPITASGVGPTFTTVTVGGNTTIGGILDVAGAIKNTIGGILQINSPGGLDINAQIRNDTVPNAPVMFNDANGVAIKAGDLDIQAGGILNSNGILNIKSSIDINGQIRNDTVAGAPVSFNDGDGVALKAGDLDIQAGGIKNTVGGTLKIVSPNGLDIQGSIKNTTSTFSQLLGLVGNPVNIADSLAVAGSTITTGKTQANGGLDVNGDKLNVSTEAQFSGGISMYGGDIHGAGVAPVSIGSDLAASKNISAAGEIKAGTWLKTKDFQSTGALFSDGDAYFKFLDVFNEGVGDVQMQNGNIRASGDLTIGNNVKDQKFLIYPREGNVFKGDFLQITSDKADGTWDWSNGIIMKRGAVEGSPSTVFQVNGKITSSTGFGTIRRHDSAGKVIAGGATGSDKVVCDTVNYKQEKLISCGANQSGWGYLNSIVPDYGTGTCTAYVKNTDAAASTLTVYAMCLDSAN